MNDNVKRFHSAVISEHNAQLYDQLIYERNITSGSLKEVDLENEQGELKTFTGYFAVKDKLKYLVDMRSYKKLPIKVKTVEKYKYRDDVIMKPTTVQGFRIDAKHTIKFKGLVDGFAPFLHSHPDQFTLAKVIVLMGDIGRTYISMVSEPNFAKSSLYKLLNALNNRTPCYQPRSIPGCLNKITSDGNIVWDDIINVPADARKAMEDMSMQIADGSSTYHNGAMKSVNTKNKYDTRLQSLTYLYNNVTNYKDPDKKYFDNMFENNGAMDDRFLKIRLDGRLTQKFHRDFDITGTAVTNRDYYVMVAKELAYLQQYKQSGKYVKRYKDDVSVLQLKGRKRLVYDEICWGIDNYAESQEEYDKFVLLLDQAILSYREMLMSAGILSTQKGNVEEEVVE